MQNHYDVIVVGGGHAGSEAAYAAAKLGKKTLLLCLNKKMISNMPCNPHIGGSAKGIVVREIDALGGIMGKIADQHYLQMKLLNTSKGPGVQSLRAQEDKILYPKGMQDFLAKVENLEIEEHECKEIITSEDRITGIKIEDGTSIKAEAVILTTGTHLESKVMRGFDVQDGGPDGERPAHGLSKSLMEHGIELFRLKTGTPQRIDPSSIDWELLEPQYGTDKQLSFSYDTKEFLPFKDQIPCFLTYTNASTHALIRQHLNESSMYGGVINGIGPRYCPSIETKIVRFADKPRHELFLEPESILMHSIYLQGFSTSMPTYVQDLMVHSLKGLEHARILKYAYAIEYDAIKPLQFDKSLMLRKIKGLFGAGQIMGTSGYEEAASLGLMAGINACLYLDKKPPFILRRDEAYIGIMIDDLITKGTEEPYRLLSSRSEYRLLTRSDNADTRLLKYGYELGLNSKERYEAFLLREKQKAEAKEIMKKTFLGINPAADNYLMSLGFPKPDPNSSYYSLLKRQPVSYDELRKFNKDLPELSANLTEKTEIEVKYEGYIAIQVKEAERIRAYEGVKIPSGLDFIHMDGLSLEAREKLDKIRPQTLGEAMRITNVHPADINCLLVHMKKGEGR
ncbi:MAG: tRNA uridine-5-carboxymethylaminomethyl(34) synthesis enzyme MnmG [Bacilli bacterium]|jgi:tRNA uridine 5-carboxymethylaminomethyl modification enzyme|nr:tRNA uridine-5-carboxymethylaminomethyl(34) synthesis enzyme MnmG [Bacilli bacterium]